VNFPKQITQAWNKARQSILEVGLLLVEAKDTLPHGSFTEMIEQELPFTANTAQRLMAIAQDQRLADPAHGHVLPASWRTLYELTKLDNLKFYEAVGTGAIHPEMTRKQAIVFRTNVQPNASKKPSKPFPTKRYDILYVDPPWHYGSQKQFHGNKETSNGASSIYPTIKTEDLKRWDIESLCEDDCLLFMWSTSPHLAQAIELGQAWGFAYSTVGFVWHKEKTNPSSYTMSECELCLIFKRGKIPQPRGSRNIRQFLSEKRTSHSTKPNEVMTRITKMFPTQTKLELFSRMESKGADTSSWDHWGNEARPQEEHIENSQQLERTNA